MSFEPRTCSMTAWNILLIRDELEMSKALVEHHGQSINHPSKHEL
jgi:hypothetical protein